ncbi:MAG: FAD-dependent oxidoreductase [Bacteroidales bacterium]|nr:FAD-dependent oxidoreductase [Bacteroidales bacterium]
MIRRDFLRKMGAGAAVGMISPHMMFAQSPEKASRIPTLPALEADVVVVGAGPSGVPAAIAAARAGAKVILLERDMTPGGAPVNMYVSMLCGGPRVGIYREMAQKLNAEHTITGAPLADFGQDGANNKNHWYLPSSYILVISQMIAAEKNIQLLCGTEVDEVIVETKGNRNTVKGVRVKRFGSVLQDIKAKVTIDATGTGLIGELSGAPAMYGRDGRAAFSETIGTTEKDEKVQRCTWMYISQRLKPDAVMPWAQLKSKGMVEDDLDHWVKGEDTNRKAGIYLHWGATVICEDTRDPVAIAEAQRKGLQTIILPDSKILHDAGFMMHLAPRLGVREVRRIQGEYVLTVDDLKKGTYAEDTIAYSAYGLDAWGENIPKEESKTKPYGIPYRCLLPLHVDGLFIVGKSISGTHLAASSYRVQPIVSSIGEAAGTAAAMAVQKNTSIRNVDIKELQKKLTLQGLFVKKVE